MPEPLLHFGYLIWVAIGLLLLVVELVAPVTYFLWLGIAALANALVVFFLPDPSWQLQLLIFSVLAIISILYSRTYWVKRQSISEQPNLNQRAQQYVGREFTLIEPIKNGKGKIRVDDSYWVVTGPTLEAGEHVEVINTQGVELVVRKIQP